MTINEIYKAQGIDPAKVIKYMNLSHVAAQLAENYMCIADNDLRKYTNYGHEWKTEIKQIRNRSEKVLERANNLGEEIDNAFFNSVSHLQDISEILSEKYLSEEDYVRIKALLTNYKPVNK
jgi:hypothetical protein